MRVIFDTRIVKRMNNELATAQYAVESAGVCVVGRTAALYTVRQKKLHRFIFAIALSERRLLWQFLAHVYINKFSTIFILYILYIIRDGEPA